MSELPSTPRRSWGQAIRIYFHPRVASMLFLGFSAGLPFMLVFTTLTAWLTEAGVARASIGFFSWIGITYSIKVLWAPVVDRIQLPLLGRWLGKRRSWMLLAQLMIASGLVGMAMTDPVQDLTWLAVFALLVAFGSATQDVAIDAWRIEAASTERQAAMSAVYVFSYRIALLVAGAGALHMVGWVNWPGVYLVMAGLMGVGMLTVLLSAEPKVARQSDAVFLEERVQDYLTRSEHVPPTIRAAVAWLIGAVVCPFVDFFRRYGREAMVLLLVVGTYRISDISMGAMAMPFYLDMGFTRAAIANITGIYGLALTVLGGITGGLLVPRYGLMPVLLAGAILSAATNLLFSLMAVVGPETWMLVITISGDNFCGGLAMAVLIAWMSSLVNSAYTATQYALFSSLMTLPGKFIGGFSGIVVESHDYFLFFIYVALLGLPAILLVAYLMWKPAIPDGRSPNEVDIRSRKVS
jgi:MFS transporter, PAT family, beta-lactamase induction signal transducer AmpG